jgi:hypothetical protein
VDGLSAPNHKGTENIYLGGRDAIPVDHSWPTQNVDQFAQSRFRV